MTQAPARAVPKRKIHAPAKAPGPEERFAAYLKGKSCVIVGPAGYLKGRGLGGWIDSHDVVIKLNWGETLPHEDYGSRTDVLYKRLLKLGHADEILIQEYVDAGIKWVIAIDNPLNRQNIAYLQQMIGDRIQWFIDGRTRQDLMRELGNSPLLGQIVVKDLLRHEVESVTVTGCDFYLSGYAPEYGGKTYRSYMKRREGVIGPTHDGPKQLRWLKQQRERDSRLHFDQQLEELSSREISLPDPKAMQGVTAIIPARWGSSRFEGKPLALIAGKPMIVRVCERVARVVPSTFVATDDQRIVDAVESAGFKAIMTGPALTGTDRVAQATAKLPPANIYLNVQGDEPLVDQDALYALVEAKRKARFEIVNAMTALQPGEAESRDVVKAVIRKGKSLVYCSRAPLPAGREGHAARWKQLGLYAFDRTALKKFTDYGKRAPLEEAEDVEILRFIELGVPVRMVEVKAASQAVDRPEDIAKVEELLKA